MEGGRHSRIGRATEDIAGDSRPNYFVSQKVTTFAEPKNWKHKRKKTQKFKIKKLIKIKLIFFCFIFIFLKI